MVSRGRRGGIAVEEGRRECQGKNDRPFGEGGHFSTNLLLVTLNMEWSVFVTEDYTDIQHLIIFISLIFNGFHRIATLIRRGNDRLNIEIHLRTCCDRFRSTKHADILTTVLLTATNLLLPRK